MTEKFFDLNVTDAGCLKTLADYGFCGAVVVVPFEGIEKLREKIEEIKKDDAELDVLVAAKVVKDVVKSARKAIEYADLIYAAAGVREHNRQVSECWEVDLLLDAGWQSDTDQKSGIDYVSAKNMAEKNIHLEVNVGNLISTYGGRRTQLINKILKSITLAKKAGAPISLSSGAGNPWGVRAPKDLMSVGESLGLTRGEAKKAVGANPCSLVERARDRADPDVILSGLRVLDWGSDKPKLPKKKFGWY